MILLPQQPQLDIDVYSAVPGQPGEASGGAGAGSTRHNLPRCLQGDNSSLQLPNTDCTWMAAVAVSVKAPHRMSPPSWSVSPAAALNCRLPPNSARRDCSSTEICRTIWSAVRFVVAHCLQMKLFYL